MRISPLGPLLGLILASTALRGAGQPGLSCSPDVPVAQTGDTVTVRAFTPVAGAHLTWTATAGAISGPGAEARWSLGDAPAGIYRATVHLGDGGSSSSCSIRLVLVEKVRSKVAAPALESGSDILLPGQTEASGYGLYSYLLLGAPPVDSTRDRYLQVIATYLSLTPSLVQLRQNIRPKDLNATYLLLTGEPPQDMTPDWVLKNYDYARARSLLRLLPGQLRIGPYFVSSANPLLGVSEIPRPYLLQDMSTLPAAPKDLVTWWVREFMNQAAQQRFWDTNNGEQFALKLRTTLAVLGAGLPDVTASLKQWVSWMG